jgi:hypothetical protein
MRHHRAAGGVRLSEAAQPGHHGLQRAFSAPTLRIPICAGRPVMAVGVRLSELRPCQGLVDCFSRQAGRGGDRDEEGGLLAGGTPCPGFGGVEVVDPDRGALPDEAGDRAGTVECRRD